MKIRIPFLLGLLLSSLALITANAATQKEQIAIDLAIVLNGGMEPEQLVALLIEQKPELAEDIFLSVTQAHPEKATTIAQAAISAAPIKQQDQLLLSAINLGIDPTGVATATAAGVPNKAPNKDNGLE
ncbi:hypothetical protein [Vibrio algarum]|uniref:HEAT repeat domain-containing protein n=1 Tax=Vibrio algarum TaxID=3020714 RepID=A0ABT4YT58_9VIBR|nr:hypothetical protein [Vibrio sp. KJ40-1]MDB1124243.1 hypothetical protein [Vibrio sp. KJ40-1]